MEKRSIKISEFVRDVKSGLTYVDLLETYRLNSKQFQKVFKKLVQKKSLKPSDLVSGLPEMKMEDYWASDYFDENTRRSVRDPVDFPLLVYDKYDTHTKGTIRDISERGIQIKGVLVYEGDLKTFVIPEHEPYVVDLIEFDAICRWAKKQYSDEEYLGGFEVLRFSQGSLADIVALMRYVSGQLKTQDLHKL